MKLCLLVLLTGVFSGYLERLNKIRGKYGLPKAVYDCDLHNKLIEFRNNLTDDCIFYDFHPNKSLSFTTPSGVIRTNRLKGSFYEFNTNKYNYTYMFRDTMQEDKIHNIMNMRINQGKCLNWKLCNKKTYNKQVSCLKPNKKDIFVDNKPCSYAHAYLPELMKKSMTSFACVQLSCQGRYVPINLIEVQFFSFFCFSNSDKSTSDYPFNN